MNYYDLSRILKRFSFDEKINICHKYSRQIMSLNGINNLDLLSKKVLPWELETFLLLSIKANEWDSKSFFEKDNYFRKIIQTIRDFQHPKLSKYEGNLDYINHYVIVTGLTQFEIQHPYQYKLYRYWNIFSFVTEKINIPEIFFKKFGCDYREFAKLGYFLWVLLSPEIKNSEEIIISVIKKYPVAFQQLVITRADYIKQLERYTNSPDDYISCSRLSYLFPFILEGQKVYLPLPHLLIDSVTSSLYSRLTDKDNDLRSDIGKPALENYLYEIINDSHTFSEVYREMEYFALHNNHENSSDILTRVEDDYIFFEVKSITPQRNVRILDENSIIDNINKMSKGCCQLYKQFLNKFPKFYNPFNKSEKISKDNLWGVLVVLNESNVSREKIYSKAAEELRIQQGSEEYNWLCGHISITDVSTIERYCFVSESLLPAIKRRNNRDHYYDYGFNEKLKKNRITNKKIPMLLRELQED